MAWTESDFQTLRGNISDLFASQPNRTSWEAQSTHERQRIVALVTECAVQLLELKTRAILLG
jgi:hypothetical protein